MAYVQTLDSTRTERNTALREFRTAVTAEAKAEDRLSELRAERKLDRSSVSLDRLAEAVQTQQSAALRADGARARYVALRQSTPSADARRMTVLGQAGAAAGDRTKNTQRLAAVGLVAGLALGLAVALVLPRRAAAHAPDHVAAAGPGAVVPGRLGAVLALSALVIARRVPPVVLVSAGVVLSVFSGTGTIRAPAGP